MTIFDSSWAFGGGEIVYKDESQLGPRRQEELQIVYLLEGDVSISVNGRSYELLPGEMTLLLPGALEFFRFAQHGFTRHGWCRAYLPSYDVALLNDLEARPDRLQFTDAMRWLTGTALSLQNDHSRQALSAYRQALLQAAFCEFFSQCAMEEQASQKAPEHPAVERACAFIEAHIAEPIDLPQVAAHANMTASHLARLFRESKGITPMRYLWNVRLQASAHLLRETGLTISEVSYRSGFSNPQHFSKLFKRKYEKTPGQFRAFAWSTESA